MSSAASPTATAPPRKGFQRFWRALKQLFLEVAGASFAVLGLLLLNLAVRSWTRDISRWPFAGAVSFALLFFFFAVSSFRRAKRL